MTGSELRRKAEEWVKAEEIDQAYCHACMEPWGVTILDAYEAGFKEAKRWRKYEDGYPELNEMVLVALKSGVAVLCYFDYDDDEKWYARVHDQATYSISETNGWKPITLPDTEDLK